MGSLAMESARKMTVQYKPVLHRGDAIDNPSSTEPSPVILRLAIIALLVGAVGSLIALRLFSPDQVARAFGPGLVALLAVFGGVLHARGRTHAARNVLSYGLWIIVTGILIETGGVHAPAVIVYPVIILMSGWLINVRTALALTGLSVMATVGLVLAEMGGWLPKPPINLAPLYAVVQSIVSVLCAALIFFIVRSHNKRVEELSRASSDLARRTRDLEASQGRLQRAQTVANVGSWEFDLAHDVMYLSAETCRIYGLPVGTQRSHAAYLARVHPDDRAGVDAAWQAAINGQTLDHEHRIRSGKFTRWVRQKAELDFAEDGRVLHAVGVTHDITERKEADEKIKELAFFDQLTGLPNRTLLHERLTQRMNVNQRSGSHGALLFIDLDNFKTLNDTRGHDIGDMLLKQVSQRLRACMRIDDIVARLGGDEFVVMLPGNSTNRDDCLVQTQGMGEKILQTLSLPYQLGIHPHHCTSSIGITLFGGGQHELIDEPLKRADLAMYQAKAAGRNTLRFFDPVMQVMATDRAALELGLREALAQGEFVLFYQALVMGDRQLTGAEALVRWKHPQRGMVSPAEFIPLAEETGQILSLGHWVLETACTQLAAWAGRSTLAQLTVAVNVSARQFRQSDFVDEVLGVLERTGANPHLLKLELTESLLLSNVEDIISKMKVLRTHGVRFALDDFGTGYSSLAYLSRLPLDQLKIDRSFVMDIESNDNSAAICAATINLAHSLGLQVVAEGVETEAQWHFLQAVHGCDCIQGFLISRPLPIAEFERFADKVEVALCP